MQSQALGPPKLLLILVVGVWGLGFRVQGLGIYLDNGKENGNYYSIIGYILIRAL